MLTTGLFYLAFRFIWPSVSSVEFYVTSDTIRFHANETSNVKSIAPHLHSLSRVLQKKEIQKADISFALSNSLNADDVDDFLPGSFGHFTELKLNFGNTNIGDRGTEYIVNALPITLEKLDLSLDSIEGTEKLGSIVGTGLARLSHLKFLRLSFILNHLGDQGVVDLLNGLSHLKDLQNLTLILIANDLTINGTTAIKSFLEGQTQLTSLELNLFTNSIGAEGSKPLAEGLAKLT